MTCTMPYNRCPTPLRQDMYILYEPTLWAPCLTCFHLGQMPNNKQSQTVPTRHPPADGGQHGDWSKGVI